MDVACLNHAKGREFVAKFQWNLLIRTNELLCGDFMFDVIFSSLCLYLKDILELRKDECEFNWQ